MTETAACGCPTNPANGDVRCHVCGEYVNVRCWKCGTPRGEGTCPAATFETYIAWLEKRLRLASDPLLRPYIAPGYVPTPQEAYRKRLWELGYGLI